MTHLLTMVILHLNSLICLETIALIYFLCYSRYAKACAKCGHVDRQDNFKKKHFNQCQPDLQEGNSGFLKMGEVPETNAEQWIVNL